MVARLGSALAAAGAVAALASCSGSTEPATKVTSDGAQLNARGTADRPSTSSWFELWPTAQPSARLSTFPQSWPTGAGGPFSASVGGPGGFEGPLYPSTGYTFRLCGQDAAQPAVCAQARTFTTAAVPRDLVEGTWDDGVGNPPHHTTGSVQATFTAAGAPTGVVRLADRDSTAIDYAGRVTCLVVSGRTAVIGSVGQARADDQPPDPDASPPNASSVVKVVEAGPGTAVDQAGGLRPTIPPVATPSCAQPPAVAPMAGHTLAVTDVP